MTYPFHPMAGLFPLIDGDEFNDLAADIAAHGLREPIVLYAGAILDGRNRYAACLSAGVEPRFVEYDGDDALAFVLSLNLHRRHLNESQRAMVAGKIANLPHGVRADRLDTSIDVSTTQPEAARMLNVSLPSVQRARVVLDRGVPELIEAVERGDVAVSNAAHIARREPEDQRAAIAPTPHIAFSTGNNEWYTPAEYTDAARVVMGGIDLDPASSARANESVGAAAYFDEESDGASAAHTWRGRVWMNPPYSGGQISRFCSKMRAHVEAGDVTAACVLVNNATETAWFSDLVSVAAAVCFPSGRIRFRTSDERVPGTPLQGQAVIYIGDGAADFRREFGPFGWVALL